jgi:hypothetical protein
MPAHAAEFDRVATQTAQARCAASGARHRLGFEPPSRCQGVAAAAKRRSSEVVPNSWLFATGQLAAMATSVESPNPVRRQTRSLIKLPVVH